MRLIFRAAPLLALAAGACASGTGQSTDAASAPAPATGMHSEVRWTGSLQPTRTRSAVANGSERTKVFGTVTLTPAADNPQRMRAQLTVNMPVRSPVQARWAVLPGSCGSNAFPVTGFEVYPLVEINNTGRGQLDAAIPVALEHTGNYHVNVYVGGQQIDNVVACASLRSSADR